MDFNFRNPRAINIDRLRGRGRTFINDRLRGRGEEDEALKEQQHRRALAFLEAARRQQNGPLPNGGFASSLGRTLGEQQIDGPGAADASAAPLEPRPFGNGAFAALQRNAPVGIAPVNLTDFSASDAKQGHKNQEEAFAGLGEWFAYVTVVRNNDKLTNAQKAEQARDWAHNFKVKGYGFYQLEAEKDAEKYERLAEEDRARERQRALERERDRELERESEREERASRHGGGGPPA